jgi:tetratricopeptide (TPR) repeat protein
MHHFVRTTTALALVVSASIAYAGDLEDGQALQQAGQFEQALPKFEAAVKADPANPLAALGLSQVLTGLGRYDEAIKAVDAARKAHPENAALLAAKGRAFFLTMLEAENAEEPDDSFISACHDDATRWAKEAMKADAKCVEALLLLGQIHQKDDNGDQAIQFFQAAANADPKNFDAAFEVGNHWYLQAGKDQKNADLWSKAEQAFFGALRIDPKSARTAANIAHCKAWRKAPAKDVADAYLRALMLAPQDANLYRKYHDWTPAGERVAAMQKLSDEAPKDVLRLRWLAFAHQGARDYKKALDALEKASKADPTDPWVPLEEGDVTLAEGKKIDDAIDFYVEALSLFKGKGGVDRNAYLRLAGSVAFENQALSESQREKVWTVLWKLCPDRYDAANNAGLWFRDVGKDYKKSLEWYLRAAEVAQDDACVQNDTGLIYHYHFQEYRKAEPFYRKAIAIGAEKGYDWNAPKPPGMGYRDALNNLAKILVEEKRWSDLKKFAETDCPKQHALREVWIRQAEEKK